MAKFRLILVVFLAHFPLSGIAQKVEIVEETGGVKYAAINTEGMPRKTEERSNNSNFYVEADLYTYSLDGKTSTPILDTDGKQIVVKRMRRHTTENKGTSVDYNVSKRFIVSPTIVYSNGTTDGSGGGIKTKIDWATANGYLTAANSNGYTISASATPMGCPKYKGKSGTDAEGTWRVPTHKEGALIAIFYKELENTSGETGFQPFVIDSKDTYYRLATESSSSDAWSMLFLVKTAKIPPVYQVVTRDKDDTYYSHYLRCIRDIK